MLLASINVKPLTHIKIVFFGIVHYFNQLDYVWMIQFFEDSNFSIYLKTIYELYE